MMLFKKLFRLSIFLLAFQLQVNAQQKPDFVPFINTSHPWVDSVFQSLSPRERVAQLFLVRAHTNLGQKYIDSVAQVIKDEQLGGLVVFQGGPQSHVEMFNQYQALSKVPLMITYDGEWGLGMRLPDSTLSFPYQMTLGAIQNNKLLYDMGLQVAQDFHRMGMHFNFAPVVDINNNPNNPVIGFRSFGDNKQNVARKAAQYMHGMVDGGIIASLKHFPGHGDTDVDSHHDLPQLNFSKERLDTLEMYPFKELIKEGAPAIMVAHMHIPSLDSTKNIPSSISKRVVDDLLKTQLGFRGLAVTDAMDMKGAKKFFPNGEADVQAVIAGNDLLEISENSKRAVDLILLAIEQGRIRQEDIDARVKKVLASKLWLGLDRYQPVPTTNLYADLHRPEELALIDRMAEESLTLLNKKTKFNAFDPKKGTSVVSMGVTQSDVFENSLSKGLSQNESFFGTFTMDKQTAKELLKQIKKNKQIVVAIHDSRSRPRPTVELSEGAQYFLKKLAKKSVVVAFTNPYALNSMASSPKFGSLILAYQNDDFMQKAAAKLVLHQINAKGKLSVTVNKKFKYGTGL